MNLKDLSYTDCTTFAAMRQSGITEVFTADEHFLAMGFVKIP
jgi:predicted nucleic acid-binding protein